MDEGESGKMPRSQWIHDAHQQRAEELINHAHEPSVGFFAWRRIPGTTSLALTNLLAAGLLFDNSVFSQASVLIFARTLAPAWVWGAAFLVSSIALLIAVFTRRLGWLNLGGSISLFAWTAVSVAGIVAWFTGEVELSPVAGGLFFWMVAGQASMLITPLLGHGRGVV